MIIQIYEIQTPADAEAMIALGVDHIGSVITDPKNWKEALVRETVRTASENARGSLIPLFDNVDRISFALDYYRPDIVHFCQTIALDKAGWEAACGRMISLQATVKERFPEMAVMRTIPVPPPGAGNHFPVLPLARFFEPLSDYFLIDTCFMDERHPGGAVQPVEGFVGITGKPCDWEMAARLVQGSAIPVILAGGLSPENVRDGILAVNPFGVDSCTRTNAVDENGKPIRFRKDTAKVAAFVAEARGAYRELRPPL